MGKVCAVYGCNSRYHPGTSFHHFPKLCHWTSAMWVSLSGNVKLLGKTVQELAKGYWVCTKHFSPDSKHKTKRGFYTFKSKDIVPTLCLPKSLAELGYKIDQAVAEPDVLLETNETVDTHPNIPNNPQSQTSIPLDDIIRVEERQDTPDSTKGTGKKCSRALFQQASASDPPVATAQAPGHISTEEAADDCGVDRSGLEDLQSGQAAVEHTGGRDAEELDWELQDYEEILRQLENLYLQESQIQEGLSEHGSTRCRDSCEPSTNKQTAPQDKGKENDNASGEQSNNHLPTQISSKDLGIPDEETFVAGKLTKNRTPKKKLCKRSYAELQRELKQQRIMCHRLQKKILQVQKGHVSDKLAKQITLEYIRKQLTTTQCALLESQIENCGRQPTGRRYSDDCKLLGLTLYYKSSRVYEFLRKIFTLPSRKTLLDFLSNQKIGEGWNEYLIEALKITTQDFSVMDKYVVLMFDGISLVPEIDYHDGRGNIIGLDRETGKPATQAQVLMIRGLYSSYKQPIYYSYHDSHLKAPTLKKIIDEAIDVLHSIGLIVKVLVCDQCGPNQNLFNKYLKVSKEKPYYFRKSQKIYCMFDPPHLIKSVRNNLQVNDLYINKNTRQQSIVRWKYIADFYEMDSQLTVRLAPYIGDLHVYGKGAAHMRVYLAAQIFSRTLAAALYTYSSNNWLPAEAIKTAEFLELMDQLFDSFNGTMNNVNYTKSKKKKGNNSSEGRPAHQSSLLNASIASNTSHNSTHNDLNEEFTAAAMIAEEKTKRKKFKTVLTDTSPHKELWYKVLEQLDNMVFYRAAKDTYYRPACLNGLSLTIRAMMCLWEEMKGLGYSYLPPGRLNQDPLENFFGQVRYHSGSTHDVTPIKFGRVYKTLLMSFVLSPSRGTNCMIDKDVFLRILKPTHLRQLELEYTEVPSIPEKVFERIKCSDQNFSTLEGELSKESVGYAKYAGYISKRLLQASKYCPTCKVIYSVSKELRAPEHEYLNFAEEENNSYTLTTPSVVLSDRVKEGVIIVKRTLNHHFSEEKLRSILDEALLEDMQDKEFSWMSNCSKHGEICRDTFISVLRRSLMRAFVKRENEQLKQRLKKQTEARKTQQLARSSGAHLSRPLFSANQPQTTSNLMPPPTPTIPILAEDSFERDLLNESDFLNLYVRTPLKQRLNAEVGILTPLGPSTSTPRFQSLNCSQFDLANISIYSDDQSDMQTPQSLKRKQHQSVVTTRNPAKSPKLQSASTPQRSSLSKTTTLMQQTAPSRSPFAPTPGTTSMVQQLTPSLLPSMIPTPGTSSMSGTPTLIQQMAPCRSNGAVVGRTVLPTDTRKVSLNAKQGYSSVALPSVIPTPGTLSSMSGTPTLIQQMAPSRSNGAVVGRTVLPSDTRKLLLNAQQGHSSVALPYVIPPPGTSSMSGTPTLIQQMAPSRSNGAVVGRTVLPSDTRKLLLNAQQGHSSVMLPSVIPTPGTSSMSGTPTLIQQMAPSRSNGAVVGRTVLPSDTRKLLLNAQQGHSSVALPYVIPPPGTSSMSGTPTLIQQMAPSRSNGAVVGRTVLPSDTRKLLLNAQQGHSSVALPYVIPPPGTSSMSGTPTLIQQMAPSRSNSAIVGRTVLPTDTRKVSLISKQGYPYSVALPSVIPTPRTSSMSGTPTLIQQMAPSRSDVRQHVRREGNIHGLAGMQDPDDEN